MKINFRPPHHQAVLSLLVAFACSLQVVGQTRVITEFSEVAFQFDKVPPPSANDAATNAVIKIARGRLDPNSAGIEALRDGRLPASEDDPKGNFFFAAGTDGGSIEIDLGRVTSIQRFASYSWHPSSRAPQVYNLYGAVGDEDGLIHTFNQKSDPVKSGWHLIANVDSRPQSNRGSQHGVCVTDTESLGRIRFLLIDISPTETNDPFGNTFFSEIDIYDVDGPAPVAIEMPKLSVIAFEDSDGKYKFTIDTTNATDLHDWCDIELRPIVQTWYPKIVEILPSDGFVAPGRVRFQFQDDSKMKGIPAYANGNYITLNTQWFRHELKREARGTVVHEMVHVVQSYSSNRRTVRASIPGWIVEGIPDYIRWFLYEPESNGAAITEQTLASASYDASYRVTGNFFDYLTREHDKDIVAKLNAAARTGTYDAAFWNQTLGKSVLELDKDWKEYCRKKIDAMK